MRISLLRASRPTRHFRVARGEALEPRCLLSASPLTVQAETWVPGQEAQSGFIDAASVTASASALAAKSVDELLRSDDLLDAPQLQTASGAAQAPFADLLALSDSGEPAANQNPVNPFDVNNDGDINPLDALLVLTALSRNQPGSAPQAAEIFPDVNGDGSVTPLDALLILNRLSRPTQTTVTHEAAASGHPLNQSTLTFTLLQSIQQADPASIRLTGTAINPADGVPVSVRIPILSASPSHTDASVIVLRTGIRVPQGARLTWDAGALVSVNGNDLAPQTYTIGQGLSLEDFTMAVRPFAPTNVNLFTNLAFPDAMVAPIAPGDGLDELSARHALQQHFQIKVQAGQLSQAEANQFLERFDAPQTKAIIPHPSLRAGLLSLAGTVASGAIDAALSSSNESGKPFKSIDFDPNLENLGALAQILEDGSIAIRVGHKFQGEHIEALGALLAHEVMHQDNFNGQQEEIIAEAARALAWGRMLLARPDVANQNTALVRSNNVILLALLNSGRSNFPSAGLISSPQIDGAIPKVFLGGRETVISLDNFTRTNALLGGVQDIDTPGNAFLANFVSKVTQSDQTGNGFTRETRDLIDAQQQVISNADALRLASILGLEIQRTLLATEPNGVSVTAVRPLTQADGRPDNKSEVTLLLPEGIALADVSRVSLSGTALNPVSGEPINLRIPILSLAPDPQNPQQVILITGQQTPVNARLTFEQGALQASSAQSFPQQSLTLPEGLSQTDFTMASRPFAPTDVNLFTRAAFPAASIPPIAAGNGLDEATARQELDTLLQAKVQAGQLSPIAAAQYLERFDDPQSLVVVPHPSLRAGLISLAGTVASGAIEAVFTEGNDSGKPFASIDFDPNTQNLGAFATELPDGSRAIRVGHNLQGEPFQALGALIAHEVMHQDNVNGQQEEVIAEAASAFSWAQILLVSPELAQHNSIVVRTNNSLLLALLNSGSAGFPGIGIDAIPPIQSNGTVGNPRLFVGGLDNFQSFDHLTRTNAFISGVQDIDTPGNVYLVDFISKVTRSNQTGDGFTRHSRDLIDAHQKAISNDDALKLAATLKLTVITR